MSDKLLKQATTGQQCPACGTDIRCIHGKLFQDTCEICEGPESEDETWQASLKQAQLDNSVPMITYNAALKEIGRLTSCTHPVDKREGGNDYQRCGECGLSWDYRTNPTSSLKQAEPQLRHTCFDPAGELVEEYCAACEDSSVSEWVQERYDNCIRLAAEKSGSDKDGWLNDAEYFRLIVLRLSSNFSTKLDEGKQAEPPSQPDYMQAIDKLTVYAMPNTTGRWLLYEEVMRALAESPSQASKL